MNPPTTEDQRHPETQGRARSRTTRHLRALAAVTAVGMAAVIGTGTPAAATPAQALFVGGGGIAADDGSGGIVVEGPGLVNEKHLRTVLDATVRATMSAADGTLPGIGECEPASATVVVDGERDADLTLSSTGTVCRVQNAYFPSYVSLDYDGPHEVTDAKRPQIRGMAGTLSVSVSPGGFTSLYADSFVPTT